MAASSKNSVTSKDRRKSEVREKTTTEKGAGSSPVTSSPGLITITVSPEKLRAVIMGTPAVAIPIIKEDSPAKESPATSTTLPAAPPSVNGDASDSTPGTPAGGGTPAPQLPMGPPSEGPKKKGVKRSAAAMSGNGDLTAKIRGKPGPKKKQKLDDGTLEPGRPNGLGASHKLGPKANQGAINAGLRALDRSGKPCRKWAKGGFHLKSFTGVMWEIPRWTAPPKPKPETPAEESATASAEGSIKENKENEPGKSDNSNSGGDVEMQSVPSVNPSSPAPVAIAAAS